MQLRVERVGLWRRVQPKPGGSDVFGVRFEQFALSRFNYASRGKQPLIFRSRWSLRGRLTRLLPVMGLHWIQVVLRWNSEESGRRSLTSAVLVDGFGHYRGVAIRH